MDALLEHKVQQEQLIVHLGIQYTNEQFIFTNTNKFPEYPIVIKIVQIRMTRLLKLCKLNTELTPHSLRHTHTSLLAEARVLLEQIMERLGHIDDQTTKEMKKEASHKFAQLMRSFDS